MPAFAHMRIMETFLAAVLFRPEEVSDRALSHGFAVALAGWDVPAPHVLIAPLRGIDGWSAAFYQSGVGTKRGAGYAEMDHACELFEDDLPPGLCVRDAAADLGHPGAIVYSIVFAEDFLYDDMMRFSAEGIFRHFVREGEDGIEAGVTRDGECEVIPIEIDLPASATADEERAVVDEAVRDGRGSSALARELGGPVLGALMGALFAPQRRVEVRLIEPDPDSIAEEVRRLNHVLGRTDGRGAFTPPDAVGGVPVPPAYQAFVQAYDWADPADPADLYRGLAIGALEGTLRFFRDPDLRSLDTDPAWKGPAAAGCFPIATLCPSALNPSRSGDATIALAADGETLACVTKTGRIAPLGPTLGELLRYLALGWKQRADVEEDLIGALMLRARLRSTSGAQ